MTQHPVVTKTLINVVIYIIGDWMSQVGLLSWLYPQNFGISKKGLLKLKFAYCCHWQWQVNWGRDKSVLDFDLARTARNGLIGAFFGPLVHYYYDFSDWILPMDVPINRVLKIVMVSNSNQTEDGASGASLLMNM